MSIPSAERAPRLRFTASPRTPHLYRLWQNLAAHAELPQVDRWLAQYFRAEKRFGKKDRQWYADAIFTALRLGPLLLLLDAEELTGDVSRLAEVARAMADTAQLWPRLRGIPAERLFLWLSLYADDAALFSALEPEKSAWVLAFKQQLASTQSWDLLVLSAGIPAAYAASLQKRRELSHWTDAQLQLFLTQQNRKAPLWLRVNQVHKIAEARAECQAREIAFTEYGGAWQIDASKSLQNLACLEQGILEIQDLASQDIGNALALEGVRTVWDCCAGGGGKTLQIASRLQDRGIVYASDVRSYKLAEVARRAARAGFSQVKTLPWDGQGLPAFPRSVVDRGGVDVILIDAPCTGTGTWRRSPDAKYRSDAREIRSLSALQLSIFSHVINGLRPGGQLVYATCSWLPEENEDIVRQALERHKELELESMQLCGNPSSDADTMFYAVLRKK